MKITPTVEQISAGVESWAHEAGWKTVGVRFADEYQRRGGGKLIPPATDEQGIRNAKQRVKRIFGLGGPRYVKMAAELSDVALRAMPTRKRIELEEPHSPELAKAKVMESFGAAMSAVAVRCPSATAKLSRLIVDLHALMPVADSFLTM
ncbi:hypothetical protein [Enterobacter bugandensis]|uniref:hypothetical protein n=1 Tax=Enterobacter bugandensis TaxID=881260 RepID=UPI0031DD35CA